MQWVVMGMEASGKSTAGREVAAWTGHHAGPSLLSSHLAALEALGVDRA